MFCCILQKTRSEYETMLNAYKNECNIQNSYTIHEYIKNIQVLHDDVKQAGYLTLLNDIQLFQKTVIEKTNELFHIIR